MTKRLKFVADDKIPFLRGALEPYADMVYKPGGGIGHSDVKEADGVFTRTRTRCDASLLKDSSVSLVATATIGFDHIDTAWCEANGVKWVNAPGCNSGSVRQYVMTALLTLAKERGISLRGMTMGVIGCGNVGSKVAAAAKAIGMNVLVNDPPKEEIMGPKGFVSLDRLLAESDIVSCHTPLTSDGPHPTLHLADDRFFNRMKAGAVFINTSRGPVVDTAALRRAVEKLYDIIIDVWENEPEPDEEILRRAFIATPHIAGYSTDGKANGTASCVRRAEERFGIDAGLREWFPPAIPDPAMSKRIDVGGLDRQEALFRIMTHTYPIIADSDRLKQSPATFEQQRSSYWVRREPEYFDVYIEGGDREEMATALQGLSFKSINFI